ncbi:MAG: glycine oxidase ThiO [Chromatiales bacterium]|nr:glycine oxidase ThiO [Chromatiales bacterium]
MADVHIIGGGLIGMLCARFLAQAGVNVAIYERGELGRESSWAGGGILSPLYPWRYSDAVTELARWGQSRYEEVAAELRRESGIDPEYRRTGLLLLDIDETERQRAEVWAGRFDYHLEYLDRKAILKLQPNLGEISSQAIWMPEVAQLRNPRLLKALRISLERLGVAIHEQTPVREILHYKGVITGLSTEQGQVPASRVVVAGGAWSAEILKGLGIQIEVAPVRGQMLLFRAEPGLLEHTVLSGNHYLIPRADGRILAGSTLEHVGFDRQITDEGRDELYDFATRLLPPLEECEVEMQWSGLRPGSPDGIPCIGASGSLSGLYINAGHFRNGVVIGLASARLLADQILGNPPILDESQFRCN